MNAPPAGDQDPISGGEHQGTSPDLVRSLANSKGLEFKLAHLDVDVYEGTKGAAEWVWPRLVAGGAVVVDDYGGDGMDGVQRAVQEFAVRPSCRMIHNLNGHAVLVKVAPR